MLKTSTSWILRALEIAIVLIQLLDIALHAVTNQLEILRVSSNGILLLWLLIVVTGKLDAKFLLIALSAIGAYLALNIIFLGLDGVTVAPGGLLRVTLFGLISLTTTLSLWLIYLLAKRNRLFCSKGD